MLRRFKALANWHSWCCRDIQYEMGQRPESSPVSTSGKDRRDRRQLDERVRAAAGPRRCGGRTGKACGCSIGSVASRPGPG